ncbi:MAG: NnrU family protein, partial [Gammaproteobacteria bacterium]|nr:NnrU family protein [Gammaproteobacteria bacterium]
MMILILGLVLFFGLHLYATFRSRAPHADLRQRWGKAKYMGLFSVVSLLGLVLIVLGYRAMPNTEYLYAGIQHGRQWVPLIMLPAMILIVCSDLPRGYIKSTVRHPMLLAVILWSSAHLIDGASLRQLLLFGSFLGYAVIDLVVVSMRATPDETPP